VLAIDTATSQTVVAAQADPGAVIVRDRWASGHVHGERLLASIVRLLAEAQIEREELVAIAVGTGPGSFTGLRVGVATAKGLAFGLELPIVGIGTAEALARAAVPADGGAETVVVLQPAGPSGRYRTIVERDTAGVWRAHPPVLQTSEDTDDAHDRDDGVVAVDLPDVDGVAAVAGRQGLEMLPETMIRIVRERMARGAADDLAALVPVYVTLPRGAAASNGSIAWSRGRA
jgi:tRNA threonylcarbamoyl adenosine modification protein YeaZ